MFCKFKQLTNYVFFIFVVKKKSQNIYTFKIMWYNYSEVRYEMSKIKKQVYFFLSKIDNFLFILYTTTKFIFIYQRFGISYFEKGNR